MEQSGPQSTDSQNPIHLSSSLPSPLASSASSFVLSLLDLSAKNIAYAILSLSDDEQRKKAIEIVEAIRRLAWRRRT